MFSYILFKYRFLLLSSIIYILYTINKYLIQLKVCVCSIGKNENKYIREFAEHYKKYGVNKIFIYDNNDINGENYENIIEDYIKSSFIQIINIRGKQKMQYKAHNHCYMKNKKIYDWFIFYDMDEFIHLTNIKNIKNYLTNDRFKKCNVIYLNQVLHTDNEQIYYYNKSLFERFPNSTLNFKREMGITKMIIRGNLINITINDPHSIINEHQCNSIGKIINKYDYTNFEEFYNDNYYYDHFPFKSSEEYLDKLKRGDAVYGERNSFSVETFSLYFSVNKITEAKLVYFETRTGINLTFYRNKL